MDKKLNEFLTINKNLKDFFVVNAANEESEHSDEISSDFVMNKEVMNSEFEIESYDDMLSQNEIKLLSGKQLTHGMNENGFLRRRTYLCNHRGSYESNTEKDTVTKKMQFDTHNHSLDRSRIIFEDEKQFTAEMLADVKFMTESCKFGAIVQRKFLESKYPTQTICSKNLYSTIQKFHPNKNHCLMTQQSNRKNILLAQALLCDESVDLYKWAFMEIIKATNIYPAIKLTDADPAVDAMVHQIFTMTYPIYCVYHLTQNLHKNLKKLLGDAYQNFLYDF
ncbi:13958_t:CDS:2 [Gigaspora rosea]|nr:13958_t:CDS:2 [Gigaspora rosea]